MLWKLIMFMYILKLIDLIDILVEFRLVLYIGEVSVYGIDRYDC